MAKILLEYNSLPTDKGFYWARTDGTQWWNLIVKVWGDFPFLRISVWDYMNGVAIDDGRPMDIVEFGPMITVSAPKIDGRKRDWT